MRTLLIVFLLSTVATAKIAPPFQGELLGGGRGSLKQYLKADRVLLVSFWATWCSPCLEELKKVTENLAKDPSLPLEVVTINVDTAETASDVKPTVRLQGFSFPVMLDPKQEIFSKYHQAKTLPFSVLLSPDGNIEATFNGFHEEMFTVVKNVAAKKNSDAH